MGSVVPIYEYRCPQCGHEFEKLVRNVAVVPACPKCGADEPTRKVSLSGFQLKGTGWYSTDYKPGAAPASAAQGPPNSTDGKSEGDSGGKGKGDGNAEGGSGADAAASPSGGDPTSGKTAPAGPASAPAATAPASTSSGSGTSSSST